MKKERITESNSLEKTPIILILSEVLAYYSSIYNSQILFATHYSQNYASTVHQA